MAAPAGVAGRQERAKERGGAVSERMQMMRPLASECGSTVALTNKTLP